MNTENKIITDGPNIQKIYVDEQNRILGRAITDGIEIESDINFEYESLTFDYYPKYKYENGEVLERTEAEIEADRETPLVEPTLEERINDLEIAVCELADALM